MKHIRIFFVLLIVAFTSFQVDAQDVKLRSNIGFAGYANPFDGYFFSLHSCFTSHHGARETKIIFLIYLTITIIIKILLKLLFHSIALSPKWIAE